MSLIYYMKERVAVAAAHPEASKVIVSFPVAVEIIRRLARECEVKIIDVRRTSGRRRSTWNPYTKIVTLNCDDSNAGAVWLRTVVHEFCHALDGKMRPQSARWHDRVFMELVVDYVGIVHSRGMVAAAEQAIADVLVAVEARAEERAAKDAERNSPAALRARKIERRREQVKRLERKVKALTTRLATAKRSLAALERAAARAEAGEAPQAEVAP